MAGRFLQMFKPVSRFLPTISSPKRRVSFTEKIFWTLVVLVLYLIMSEVPLYLSGTPSSIWELSYMRVIFASKRGTLMELGIGPIVTAGLILQLLVGSGMIECDMSNPEDRATFTSASKAFSIIFTGIQASAYIIGGVYGRLAPVNSIIVFLQLLSAGVVIILLDELLQKGWGIGSGISLFIMAGVAQTIFWDCFNPFPVETGGRGHGVFVALVQTLIAGESPWNLFVRARNLPSLLGFITTMVVFLTVIYIQEVRVELPISHATYRGYRSRYPIRLLYVSNLPVIFASSLFANVYFFSQIFWYNFNRDGSNLWLNLLGRYETVSQNGQSMPKLVGGLAYYMIAPKGILDVMGDPLRAFAYAAILIVFCALFSMIWLEVGGLGPSTVARQLVDSGMQIPGYRRSARSIEMLLKRYIPAVTVLGGIIVGALAAFSDFLGAFGSGTGILLAVGILYQYYELLMRERIAEMYPALSRVLGG